MLAQAGDFQDLRLVFQQSQNHSESNKKFRDIPYFGIDVQVGKLEICEDANGEDQSPEQETSGAGDYSRRPAAVASPEKKSGYAESERQRGVEPCIRIVVPHFVDGPGAGDDQNGNPGQHDGRPWPTRKKKDGGPEKHNRKTKGISEMELRTICRE